VLSLAADNLSGRQPAIVINMGDTVHVVSLVTLRLLARGEPFEGDCDMLIQLLARALVDLIDE
jgi:hypothetical protein